ncbi:lipase [Vibrio sp. T187]|nr:lipase [Vibrio sp. T187]MBW3697757.1 lipase [Vibrio sp. T187]
MAIALFGCQSDDESSNDPVSVFVPYNIQELPKPNDGYGYDNDGTISGVGEPTAALASDFDAYYQDYNNSYAALDGWGLCAEPILIPLQSIDSNKRFPLDENSLEGNVVLMDSDGNEIPTELSSDGSNVIIQCESGLEENTEYFIVVTDEVKTEFGESLKADSSFTELLTSPVPFDDHNNIDLAGQVSKAISLFKGDGNPVYAAQFKTQSSYAPLDAMRENHISEGTQFSREIILVDDNENGAKYDLYTQKLKIPFYLPFTKDREVDCAVDRFDMKESCPPLYEWITTESGGFPTAADPLPKVIESEIITTDIYTPADWNKVDKLPVVIFIHGVTGEKGNASLMAEDYTRKGYAVVAIDLPYHGERVRCEGGEWERNKCKYDEISARANKAYYINIDSPLALRSNLQQSVSDNLGLRYALNFEDWVDKQNIHLVGQSLGGIMSVMVSEFSWDDQNSNTGFEFETVNFVVPGQGLTNLTLASKTLGPEMSEGVKKSPDVQRAIAETVLPDICTPEASNEECILALEEFVDQSPENKGLVQQLEDDIFALLETGLKQGVQATIDSSDPASFVSRQRENDQPTLAIAAVGDCGETCDVGVDYAADVVIPNSDPNNIRTGTDPLIKALGLKTITGSTGITQSVTDSRRVIRATTGGHGTYLFPYDGPVDENGLPTLPSRTDEVSDGVTELEFVTEATDMQQVAVASMVESKGVEVVITNEDHIETEVPANEE